MIYHPPAPPPIHHSSPPSSSNALRNVDNTSSSASQSPPPLPPLPSGYNSIVPTYRPPPPGSPAQPLSAPPVPPHRHPGSNYTNPPPQTPYTAHPDRYYSPPAPPPIPLTASVSLPVRPASLPPPPPVRNIIDEDDSESQSSPSPGSSAIIASSTFALPPRPPNPETLRLHSALHAKLIAEFATVSQTLSTDAERLRANQADLLAGEPAIRDEMARLEAVRDVCKNVGGRMRTVVEAAEARVEDLRRKGDPDVDELVCSTTIVYNQ